MQLLAMTTDLVLEAASPEGQAICEVCEGTERGICEMSEWCDVDLCSREGVLCVL